MSTVNLLKAFQAGDKIPFIGSFKDNTVPGETTHTVGVSVNPGVNRFKIEVGEDIPGCYLKDGKLYTRKGMSISIGAHYLVQYLRDPRRYTSVLRKTHYYAEGTVVENIFTVSSAYLLNPTPKVNSESTKISRVHAYSDDDDIYSDEYSPNHSPARSPNYTPARSPARSPNYTPNYTPRKKIKHREESLAPRSLWYNPPDSARSNPNDGIRNALIASSIYGNYQPRMSTNLPARVPPTQVQQQPRQPQQQPQQAQVQPQQQPQQAQVQPQQQPQQPLIEPQSNEAAINRANVRVNMHVSTMCAEMIKSADSNARSALMYNLIQNIMSEFNKISK